ncbi:MAG: hypothetical protein FJZ47_09655 [Candidatus Tectomicrobia bacterium]|uniref:Cytochrome c-type biogenesis protein n=1 Tax=Tectimicrobiota bacterium TaxID=2528274 RepID=A0A938B3R7_UNCTE|nr:hypothetical protein [Candidatus Tectomicrobia bacterium]
MHWLAILKVSLMCSLICLGMSRPVWAQAWQDIAGELMSPACPGRTLLNCTSGHAEQWRELIRQKLAAGESKTQILQYFIDMSGESILAAPPKKGFALTAWLLPFFVMVNGAGLILVLTRRWARKRATDVSVSRIEPGPPTSVPASSPSDPYLERLRRELKAMNE